MPKKPVNDLPKYDDDDEVIDISQEMGEHHRIDEDKITEWKDTKPKKVSRIKRVLGKLKK